MKPKSRTFASLVIAVLTVLSLASCGLFQKSAYVSLVGGCGWDVLSPASKVGQGWTAKNGDKIVFQGWLADPISREVPTDVFISVLDSHNRVIRDIKGKSGVPRPDLVKGFKEQELANGGYLIADYRSLTPGNYTLEIRGKFQNQTEICTSTTTLLVK